MTNKILFILYILTGAIFSFYLAIKGMPDIMILIFCIVFGGMGPILKKMLDECISIIKNPKEKIKDVILFIIFIPIVFVFSYYLKANGVPFIIILIISIIFGGMIPVLKRVIANTLHQQ
ncbi:hypothetical protein MmiEs2_16280 [Methanimicrococcus stummii]|uniref:Uncharacterized protein n=1 Tax=Methanimicrococcus stummii TaxID=3028294 RepID=A0AA96VJ93_9EURY|nr:hypothetical protein [Methanimicrococcus sp. Es2]WNY29401.1 hypothetical protein MmiEs2_16280 [Methanimicrococcus sp. Es2]